jgi:hypothetical protein
VKRLEQRYLTVSTKKKSTDFLEPFLVRLQYTMILGVLPSPECNDDLFVRNGENCLLIKVEVALPTKWIVLVA